MEDIKQFLEDFLYLFSLNGTQDIPILLAYIVPFILAWTIYKKIKNRTSKKITKKLQTLLDSGGAEPASLHPIIDYNKCLGCATCVTACPEKTVLGIINDKAFLVDPTHCIGHGACKTACPQDAITLVFGSAKRGVDIPQVNPDFETNVPGIFIAGELGGMGLVRNAMEQGRQALDNIAKKPRAKGKTLDLVIVGAGPAGFSATASAMKNKLRSVTIEQESLGGCVFGYPRGKIVMTAPVEIAIYGKTPFNQTTKEALLQLWLKIEKKLGMKINYKERMESLEKHSDGFVIETNKKNKYITKNILLTIGRRGTPRKLGVPGEECSKVVYSLLDPAEYSGKHVLVVGGGNSALEAAYSIAEEQGTTVTLSYRSDAFGRAADQNKNKVKELADAGKLRVMMKSNVKEVKPDSVSIEYQDKIEEIKNEGIIVCAGGLLPTPMLKKIGIQVDTKYGAP